MNCKDSLKRADLEMDNTAAAMVEEARIRDNGFIYFAFDNFRKARKNGLFSPVAIYLFGNRLMPCHFCKLGRDL